MTINSEWIKKDFKQKYFLYCCEIKVEKLVYVKDNTYLCNQERKPVIEIREL